MNFKRSFGISGCLIATAASGFLVGGKAEAKLVFEFIQQGTDVQMNVSGSITGSGVNSSNAFGNTMNPSLALISTNVFLGTGFTLSNATPFSFGSNTSTSFLNYTGQNVLFFGGVSKTLTIQNFVSGAPISGSGLFSNKTLSSLGLSATSGLLGTWTLVGGSTDTVEFWAGPAPSNSSPAPGPLPLLGASAAFAFTRRLRSRLRATSQAPQT